jgi:hypothetical protein
MDHDDLHLPTRDDLHFRPDRILPGTFKDEAYAVGAYAPRGRPFSTADLLREIYRVPPPAVEKGMAALRRALGHAYRKTHRAVRVDPTLRRLFSPSFLNESDAWDRMIDACSRRGLDFNGDGWREALSDAAGNATLRKILAKISKPLLVHYFKVLKVLGVGPSAG